MWLGGGWLVLCGGGGGLVIGISDGRGGEVGIIVV